jgi:hypothetical protein
LVSVEPVSLALLGCVKTGDRSAAAWQQALTPFSRLEMVLSDAAKGIAAGVRAVAQARSQASPTPLRLSHGLDVFHTAMEARQVLSRQWRQAEAVWELAEAADTATAEAKRRGRNAQKQATIAYQAWRKAEQALATVERHEAAWQRARAALMVFRADGTPNDRGWAEAQIAAAVAQLPGPEWRKTRSFLGDVRTLVFLDRMHRRLAEAVPEAALRQACVRRWWLRRQRPAASATTAAGQVLQLLDAVIRDRALTAQEQAAYDRVAAVLASTVRASSAVEGINSVLRMQQCRHRRITQGLLDLKRLYWNCRKLPTGRRRDRSPYELLGVALPSTDFWSLLQTPPEKLAELVSSSQLP